MYLKGAPLFAFGHGLSYTQFVYSDLRLSRKGIPPDGEITVTVDVENVGTRTGDEVVQLYVRDIECSVRRPDRELRGFERISLAPGAKRQVEFALRAGQLAFWDERKSHSFVVEPGMFDVLLGSSSADIRATAQFRVTAPRR
jgi:beta-glucosidase